MSSLQHNIHNPQRVLPLSFLSFIFLFLVPALSFSAEFTARTIGAYSNVVVMEVTGNYDGDLADPAANAAPREVIAREFYKDFNDEYDFLVVFTDFDFRMPKPTAKAFYTGVRNDTSGIGTSIFDASNQFGSKGKLQGVVDMGNVASIPSDPMDQKFEDSLYVLAHEILHRWGAYVKFRNADGTISSTLLSADHGHWSFLLDSCGSVLYGNQWRDNGDGTFTSLPGVRNYSPLDLYLMGLVDKTQVPPILLIENPSIDPGRSTESGVTIEGTAHYVSIDDIIAVEGERLPGPVDSQKSFKTAFIFITRPGTFTGEELFGIETIRNEWVKRYSILTDGRCIVQVALMPKDVIPVNPGPGGPPIIPRTLPPNIDEGVTWLADHQQPDGSWFDLAKTAERDTAEAVYALRSFVGAQQNYASGVRWLLGAASGNTDYLARRIEALKHAGQYPYGLVNDLLSRKNPDGGWGSNTAYVSNPVDTSFALRALSAAGYWDRDTLSAAIEYLQAKQNTDGDWGRDEGSSIEVTANVLMAFNRFRDDYQLQAPILTGLAWLTQKQNADGGFGNSPSTVYDTAIAVLALQENGGLKGSIDNGVNYILNSQSKDGSWFGSSHQTALAVAAVWAATVDPDLAVKTEDIAFTPATVNTLPANIALQVRIRNLGRTDVSRAKVALYEGSVSEATRIGEQSVAVAGQGSAQVTFAAIINDANEHRYYVQLDPDNLIKESDKTNNLSSNAIKPIPTYDFEIAPADLTVSPNEVDIAEEVRITADVTNKGTMNAYNVQVRYSVDDGGGAVDIATRALDLPANTTVHQEITWKTDKTGNNLPLTVWVDPSDQFSEVSKDNNKASALLTIWPATLEPDLSIKPEDILFTPPTVTILPADIVVCAKIWNLGRTEVARAKAVLYADSVAEANKIAEQFIAVSGQSSVELSFPASIRDGNEHSFHVLLDPDNLIQESNETNNLAHNIISPTPTYDFEVLPADISITPNPADSTPDVKISAKIINHGTMDAYNVQIKYYIDEAGGPIDISTKTVDIPANRTLSSEVTWKPDRAGDNLPITVWADPFNLYTEISKTNNKASATLTIDRAIDPNLSVAYKDIVITPTIPNEQGNANISVTVKNTGMTAAANITVNFYKGIPGVDGVIIDSRVIPSIDPGESKQAAFDWTNIPEAGEKILYVKVDPQNLIKETRKEDNDAFVTMKILSLPDFAISSNAIAFTPSAPKEGDTVAIKVTVKNLGEQAVSNVPLKISEGGTVIGTQSIPLLSGNAQTVATFSYNTTAKKGAHEITVTVDPAGTIVERSKNNNGASRTFGVQDASLWLTEPYLSPNGDGIKDSTQFFFRLQEPQTVKIVVVNERDETVRTFSGGGLDNTSGDTITWDGLNDIGMVVDDGDYHLKIVDGKNNVLGSIMVVVDNNRSPLTKAIGTKYLLNNNLTCMLPDINRWDWFPDESGILVRSYTNRNAPEYPDGLYSVAPDGEDILGILPWGWSDDPDYAYYMDSTYEVSPNGEKVAFSLRKQSKADRTVAYQLWVVDRDGTNLRLLDSYEYSTRTQIQAHGWFNNDHVIYELIHQESGISETWTIKIDGTTRAKIEGGLVDYSRLRRSPDGTRIAYIYSNQLRANDLSGTKHDLMELDNIRSLEWLNDQKLVTLSDLNTLWLVDVSGAGAHLQLSDDADSFVISPDKSRVAYIETSPTTASVKVADASGNIHSPYVAGHALDRWNSTLVDLRWSPDATRLAFVDRGYESTVYGDCYYYHGYVVIIDSSTNQQKAYRISSNEYLSGQTDGYGNYGSYGDYGCGDNYGSYYNSYNSTEDDDPGIYSVGSLKWLVDDVTLLAVKNQRSLAISSIDGKIVYLPIPSVVERVSPLGRYFNYTQYVDQTSICYGLGYYDIWAMSSLLNLTTDLRVSKEKSAVVLKGTAIDLDFEGYKLEYADVKDPDTWNLIQPASDVPVINDVFATWVPPYEGRFYVKLTVWDRAGNVKWERKRLTWGMSASITNLYKTLEIFSPNGDGVKDVEELHYRALEPVHLEFNIHDKDDHIVRSYLKDHVSPVEDYITWDGRDESGRTVPDGKYKIQVFDYEFFVEVDNTPPDVGVSLGGLQRNREFFFNLYGHVFDEKVRSWALVYGEEDNPQEWYQYLNGNDLVVATNQDGTIARDADGKAINRFLARSEDIQWAVGKKFKIAAEDFAGNKDAAVTGFIEEKFLLYRWDGVDVGLSLPENETPPILPANLTKPGLHHIDVLAAFRRPIASINVQYWNGRNWIDTPGTANSPSGLITLEWNNSAIDLNEVFSVRTRAVDETGEAHYSNELIVRSMFDLRTECLPGAPFAAVVGHNNLSEKLRTLTIQIWSEEDPSYAQWTDYLVYATADGWDSAPEGAFIIPTVSLLPSGMPYKFRMFGTAEGGNGTAYHTGEASFPLLCNGPPSAQQKLSVQYPEASCNLLSEQADLQVILDSGSLPWSPTSLDYYILKHEEEQLLRHFTLSNWSLPEVSIDTAMLSEGRYQVKAVIDGIDLNNNERKELPLVNELIVDHTLPTARITYPGDGLRLCPVKVGDAIGSWYGVPIEAIGIDNNGIRPCDDQGQACGIELYYGTGENPSSWILATTRINGRAIPITTAQNLQGQLGIWDVTDLKGTVFSLKLKVTDTVGNTSCYTTSFYVDTLTEIASLAADKPLISPNGDGFLDDVNISYEIVEYTTIDLKIFKLAKNPDGSWVFADSAPVRTVASVLTHLGGTGYAQWDGRNDAGSAVPDGPYAIAVYAKDSCGNANLRWTLVEVDNTPPTATITYPRPSDPLSTIIEVKGTAEDPHFANCTLESGEGGNPDTWNFVSSSTHSLKEKVLGRWNSFALEGLQTLRLTARDAAGNEKITTVTVNLDQRKPLIKDFGVAPRIFSPNNDGKLDTTDIRYELTDACTVKIEILNSDAAVQKTYTSTTKSAGTYTYTWDGKGIFSRVVPDGIYTVKLTATLVSNVSITQAEAITVVVDTTAPTADIQSPRHDYYFKGDVPLLGTLSDLNLLEYAITYTGGAGVVTFDQGNENRDAYPFGTLVDLHEGKYTLTAKAKDVAENTIKKDLTFTIDRTPPKVTLDAPKSGEYYGSSNNVVTLTGSIDEKNLDIFSLRYSMAEDQPVWTLLSSADTVPVDPQLHSWKVGKDDGIPDGVYTLSLFAKDKVALEGEARIRITIDNTPPNVSITAPAEGEYVKSAREIRGTAFDTNLDKYSLEISEGQCSSAFKWAALKTSSTSVQEGTLVLWQTLPPDGNYCLRLSAVDKIENKAQAKVQVKVDTTPPTPPVLSGRAENRTNALLDWVASPEADTAGYNIFKGTQKLNTALINDTTHVDRDLKDGNYKYTVTAVDFAGNESKPSNEVSIRIDTKGPEARIRVPLEGAWVSGLLDIKGTAYSFDDFKQYRVSTGVGANPSAWGLIITSPVPTPYGSLAQWDTLTLPDGPYAIQLEGEDLTGNVTTHQISITVDNNPPAAPVLLTATPNGADVTLTWRANTETDLAGYLLYRNEQLANVAGIVVGNLKPYLIVGTTYVNQALPDGKHKYYLVAMDQAGNTSDQSNMLEVEIDTHPPHTTLTEPLNNAKLQNKTLVRAESPDLDIASVQFQYKKAEDAAWTDLGAPVTRTPYTVNLDPVALGMSYGDYHLRTVATDKGGNIDRAPAAITVTYADLTPPRPPVELKSMTNGRDVTLTWQANAETDLDGYNLYRTSAGNQIKINTSVVKEATYQDSNLEDGAYTYVVTAMDQYANESEPSTGAAAKIYAPVLAQPRTPAEQQTIQISGSHAAMNASVEVFADAGSGPVSQGTATADNSGKFTLPSLSLVSGETAITARAKDSAGNLSRVSDAVYVVLNEPPAAPTGLAASVQDKDVALTWSPNGEPDLAGYNLYRDGQKLNAVLPVTEGDASASSYDYYNYSPPYSAFDANPATYWASQYGYGEFPAAWWEIDLPAPLLIDHLEISWGAETDGEGTEKLYAGKDFEIQVWSGHAWITQAGVTGNTTRDNAFDFSPAYATDRIRIAITATTDTTDSRQVRIAEVKILGEILITGSEYHDLDLHDGRYHYQVTAVDQYGIESQPSNTAEATVGDVVGPTSPVGLTATAVGSDVLLNWSANPETDLAGYNIFRQNGGDWIRLNESPIAAITYTDTGLVNGTYGYRITAVDQADNESPPSNEASATVWVEPPPSPISLTVSSLPEGGSLKASWQYAGPSVSGYHLYRGTSSGGPYARVTSPAVMATTHTDTNLTNAVTYFYVVAAKDAAGNESAYSNEASGKPSDHTPPAKPELTYPALPGLPATLYRVTTDVSGNADPGSTVELFQDGDSLGRTTALMDDRLQKISPQTGEHLISLSPDGKSVAYTNDDGSLWIKEPGTDNSSRIADNGITASWALNLKRLIYTYRDRNWYNRIGIYDTITGENSILTEDSWVTEMSPSISADGHSVAFISTRGWSYDVWLKNLTDGLLTQLTSSGSVYVTIISPDAKMIAYHENNILKVIDTSDLNVVEVDTNTDGHSLDWSPDSKKLAFVSSRNGTADIFLYDISSQNAVQLSNTPDTEDTPVWSPDGKSVAFVRQVSSSNTNSILVIPASGQGEAVPVAQMISNGPNLVWLKSGALKYQSQASLKLKSFKGRFVFKDVRLQSGENKFYAVARDDSGNPSEPSEEISVTLDGGFVPDPAITADDIFIYPPYPTPGEPVKIYVAVENRGPVAVTDVGVNLYLVANGASELLKTATVAHLGAGASESLEVDWDGAGQAGSYTIYAVADPDGKIEELSESNNVASREMVIMGEGGIAMTTWLDADTYQAGQNLYITVNLENAGEAKEATLSVAIEDADGNLAASLVPAAVSLPYASSRAFNWVWNTGATFDGAYQVHSILKGSSGRIAENTVSFTILADTRIAASIATDKTGYGSHENVLVGVGIANSGKNHIISELTARITISDAGGNVVFADDRQLTDILPGALNNLNIMWETGLAAPGGYVAAADMLADNQTVPSKSTTFVVAPHVLITGSIAAVPTRVMFGSNAKLAFTVRNEGNADVIGAVLRVLVIDPETGVVMSTGEKTVDLGINDGQTGESILSTQGYDRKTYTAVLQGLYQNTLQILADTSFAVGDGAPPAVSIIFPSAGDTVGAKVNLAVTARDDVSGVSWVEYRIDNRDWNYLPVSDAFTGRYASVWAPTKADEGSRTISFRAIDKDGNTSQPVAVNIIVDLSPPAAPMIIAPEDKSSVLTETVTITGSAEPGAIVTMNFAGSVTTQANASTGAFTFTGVKLVPGWNLFQFTATDKVGNVSEARGHSLNFVAMSSQIAVDKPVYSPLEPVAITSKIPNAASDHTLRDLTARVSVVNAQGQSVFTENKSISEIGPLQTARIDTNWNTAVNPKGQYNARLEVFDASGVMSTATSGFAILGTAETGAGLKGTLTATPSSVNPGSDETVTYTVRNDGNEDVAGLVMKVVIINNATQEVKAEFSKQKTLTQGAATNGQYLVPTDSFAPGVYTAVLKAVTTAMPAPKTLDSATFEVKPSLQVTQTIPDVVNLLVWVDKKCRGPRQNHSIRPSCGDDDDSDCVRVDLLENILASSVTSYRIVFHRDDFQREMRNPIFTDYLIIGDQNHLEDHYDDELREQVYAGKGLISSSSIKDWDGTCGHQEPLFGVSFISNLNGTQHHIDLVKSPISDQGELDADGRALWVEAAEGTTVAGWINGDKPKHRDKHDRTHSLQCREEHYPAIVLNRYGEGKTVYFAFDVGATLNEENYDRLSKIINNSLTYIHKKADSGFLRPTQMVPVQVRLTSPSAASDVRLQATYPAALKIYDAITSQWVKDNPWTRNIHVDPDKTKTLLSYVLTPDKAGTYTLQTEAGTMADGRYSVGKTLTTDIVVAKDRKAAIADIIAALNDLPVSGKQDQAKLKSALKYAKNVRDRTGTSRVYMEKNIHDLLSAVENLNSINSCDTKSVQLMIDSLMMSWEGKLYLNGQK